MAGCRIWPQENLDHKVSLLNGKWGVATKAESKSLRMIPKIIGRLQAFQMVTITTKRNSTELALLTKKVASALLSSKVESSLVKTSKIKI